MPITSAEIGFIRLTDTEYLKSKLDRHVWIQIHDEDIVWRFLNFIKNLLFQASAGIRVVGSCPDGCSAMMLVGARLRLFQVANPLFASLHILISNFNGNLTHPEEKNGYFSLRTETKSRSPQKTAKIGLKAKKGGRFQAQRWRSDQEPALWMRESAR